MILGKANLLAVGDFVALLSTSAGARWRAEAGSTRTRWTASLVQFGSGVAVAVGGLAGGRDRDRRLDRRR